MFIALNHHCTTIKKTVNKIKISQTRQQIRLSLQFSFSIFIFTFIFIFIIRIISQYKLQKQFVSYRKIKKKKKI